VWVSHGPKGSVLPEVFNMKALLVSILYSCSPQLVIFKRSRRFHSFLLHILNNKDI